MGICAIYSRPFRQTSRPNLDDISRCGWRTMDIVHFKRVNFHYESRKGKSQVFLSFWFDVLFCVLLAAVAVWGAI